MTLSLTPTLTKPKLTWMDYCNLPLCGNVANKQKIVKIMGLVPAFVVDVSIGAEVHLGVLAWLRHW